MPSISPSRQARINSQSKPKGFLERLRTGAIGAAGKVMIAGCAMVASANATLQNHAEAAQPTKAGAEPNERLMAYLRNYYGDKSKGRANFRAKYLDGTVLEDHRRNIPGEMTFAIPVAKEFPADVDPKYAAWTKKGRTGSRGTRFHILRSARNKGRWSMIGTNDVMATRNNPLGVVMSIILPDDLDEAMKRAEAFIREYKIADK